MATNATLSAEEIRAARQSSTEQRDRDFAEQIGISEAQLVAAFCGYGSTKVDAHPDMTMPLAQSFGEVMALTRNVSCVHEKKGAYANYHPGNHAAMILTEDIDLRIFPSHWKHAFLVEKPVKSGLRRSLQVFDAAGDAVHKIFLSDDSDHTAFESCLNKNALQDQSTALQLVPRTPQEKPKSREDKVDVLRSEWRRLTDTHQFLRLVSKLKMNRLGAYRIAGAPFARSLTLQSINDLFDALKHSGTEVMLFVGNKGCIQIHTGPVQMLKPMGPWLNVMDPRFNLHLRRDHITEVWAVDKPTQRGMARSVEAFSSDGTLVFQVFGVPKEGRDSRPEFGAIIDELSGVSA